MKHRLSQRERECLLWGARGKTYAETAVILGVGYPSVKRYLDNARWKLGAANLPHAVAIALARGLFSFDELHIPETPLEPSLPHWRALVR